MTVAVSSSPFNSARYSWLRQVNRDRKLTLAAQRIAVLIFECIHSERGYAWPSIAYMACELNLHRSNVIRGLALLESRGWVVIEPSRGRGCANRYRLSFGTLDDEERLGGQTLVAPAQQNSRARATKRSRECDPTTV